MIPMKTQVEGAEFLASRSTALLADEPRVGKEQPVDALVMTPTGPRQIGELHPGDVICDAHGGTALVEAVYPQGIKQAYRVAFRDGAEVECGIDHLWTVYTCNRARHVARGGNGFSTYSLRQILEFGWLDKLGKSKFRTPVAPAALFLGKRFTIHPYILGCLLGDGCLSHGSVSLSIADRDVDIVERVSLHLPRNLHLTSHRTGPNVAEYRITHGQGGQSNPFLDEIRALGLNVRSGEKHIPIDYRHCTVDQRLYLLNGLMDTDGHCAKHGETSPSGVTRSTGGTFYHTKSPRLAKDVLNLVRSLGGVGTLNEYDRNEKGVEYRVTLQMSINPFLTPFKAKRWSAVVTPDAKITRAIVDIQPSRMVEQVCIKTSAPDGLYLTNDFIVTHNTGAALLALKKLGLPQREPILIVTTASGRAVWRRAVKDWLDLPAYVVGDGKRDCEPFYIVSWDQIRQSAVYAMLSACKFAVAILDEDHRAKNPETKTAQAIYGKFNKHGDRVAKGLVTNIPWVWHLSGTPCPHDLGDMWCRLRSSAGHLLFAEIKPGWPDVISFDAFRARYCVMRPKKLSAWRTIMVVMGGKNEAELRERIGGWMLRRTQKDVGIRPPVQELMPLIVSPAQRRELVADVQTREIIEAIENGDTSDLDMELGPLRRITGRIKAEAVVSAAKEWLEDNAGDKLVLAYYHREVGDALMTGLDAFVPMRIDGSTSGSFREVAQQRFSTDPRVRVFLAQIDAAGESIDLSAAPELWFCESSFSPKAMKQMASRISNVGQKRNTFVKVCFIEGSIDEAIQASLMRLWQSIREVVR